jgi:hypothetical protein
MFSLNLLAQINQQKRQVKQEPSLRSVLNNCWKMITSMLKIMKFQKSGATFISN